VVVDYEWRIRQAADEVAFPFFVHPWIANGLKASAAPTRRARLFFGGNTEEGKYDKDVIRDTYQMLTRREMLAVAADTIPADDTYKPTDATAWLASPDFHLFVFCETQRCRIPPGRWLEALSRADFFLACPGVGMPLCHNVIESLVAGCIPILQYGTYLSPPLEDRVNCLAFHDAESLAGVLESIFTMSESEIAALRANVRAYYEERLAPGRFSKRLFSDASHERQVLLLNDYRVPRT